MAELLTSNVVGNLTVTQNFVSSNVQGISANTVVFNPTLYALCGAV